MSQILILAYGLTTLSLCVAWSDNNLYSPSNWQSLVFILADPTGRNNHKCNSYSEFYCLETYRTAREEGPRFTHFGFSPAIMVDWFSDLIGQHWKKLNMVSQIDGEECCDGQTLEYSENGLSNRDMMPDEYFDLLSDYSNDSLQINYYESIYYEPICANVISKVGFGPPPLTRDPTSFMAGGRPFAVITRESPGQRLPDVGIHLFTSEDELQRKLNLFWFKQIVICKEKPWICGRDIDEIL